MPTQTPSSGFDAAASTTAASEARVVQLAHAVAHRALPRQHDALGGTHLVRRAT